MIRRCLAFLIIIILLAPSTGGAQTAEELQAIVDELREQLSIMQAYYSSADSTMIADEPLAIPVETHWQFLNKCEAPDSGYQDLVYADSRLYVLTSDGRLVQQLTKECELVATYTLKETVAGLAYDGQYFWATSGKGEIPTLLKYTKEFNRVSTLSLPYNGPQGVEYSRGKIWVVYDTPANQVTETELSTGQTQLVFHLPFEHRGPRGLSATLSSLWVAVGDSLIQVEKATGKVVKTISKPIPGTPLAGLAYDGEGTLWVAGLDTSDVYQFSINPTVQPTRDLEVLAPNGDEHLTVGQEYEIRWSSDMATSSSVQIGIIDTRFSTEAGERAEQVIVDSVPNSGSYTWKVPRAVGTMDLTESNDPVYKLMVHAWDESGGDASDEPFSITASSSQISQNPLGQMANVISGLQSLLKNLTNR